MFDRLRQDLIVSFRRLRQSPGFTAAAAVTLALGIGANATIFSAVDAIALRPLAVERVDELVFFNQHTKQGDFPVLSYPTYRDFRDRNNVLSALAAYRISPANLSRNGANSRVWVYEVTGNYFDMLGVGPAIGRVMHRDDDLKAGGNPVAVLNYGYWQKRFAGDPEIAGKTVKLNGLNYTILGVTPQAFFGTELVLTPDLYVPMTMQAQIEPSNNWLEARNAGNIEVLGRLKPGMRQPQAEAAINAIANDLSREHPKEEGGLQIRFSPPGLGGNFLRGTIMGFAAVLLVVAGLVLLIACVNLAGLLLARAADRRKETAIRLALGAGRGRIVRQLLTESALLAVIGGAAGVLLTIWLTQLLNGWSPPVDAPVVPHFAVNLRVLIYAGLASVATGVLFGLAPALQSTRAGLTSALKNDAAVERLRRWHMRDLLVAAQVAMSVVLLVGTVLVVRSLQHAMSLNLGFEPRHAAMASFDLGLDGYKDKDYLPFQQRLIEKVRALPGIESAALAGPLPLTMNISNNSIYVEGQPDVKASDSPSAGVYYSGPGYLRAMQTRLIAGRDFDERDKEGSKLVAIVNQHFVRKLLPPGDPIGKRFKHGPGERPWVEIVGVVEDGKYRGLSEDPLPVQFQPLAQVNQGDITLVARSPMPEEQMLAMLRQAIRELDPALTIYESSTMTNHLALPMFPARAAAAFLSAFGLLAIVLAATGVYGMMAYAVSRRTREIGIRMALGATGSEIVRTVLGRAGTILGIGGAVGIAMALAAGKFFSLILYGVSDKDPVTFAVAIGAMLAVALAACWLPARRAVRVDPSTALRTE
jgi:predicted permease